jgi:TetR/AcrR family transcriptional regulator, transcriptional repressor for nem operon
MLSSVELRSLLQGAIVRYKPGHREESRDRILLGAGRGFRKHGYEGIGVDGLAKEAGVTSGAFYVHFPSKAAAFKEAVQSGMRELREGVEGLQAKLGSSWLEAFIDFYLGSKRTCDLSQACALQSLTPEVVRSDAEVRAVYQAELVAVIDAVAKGLSDGTAAERRSRAWALMSLLSGAVTTARAIDDPTLSAKIAKSVRTAAMTVTRR